jgi:hypothetical protein
VCDIGCTICIRQIDKPSAPLHIENLKGAVCKWPALSTSFTLHVTQWNPSTSRALLPKA